MKYNFDEVIDRSNTNSMKVMGFRDYLFPDQREVKYKYADDKLVKMWIADMEFATPQVILDKIKERVERRILGYTKIFDDSYYQAFRAWTKKRYDYECEKEHLVTTPGIIPALYEITELLLEADEKLITFTPAYGFFLHTASHNHKELVTCSLIKDANNDMQIDFDTFTKLCSDPKVKLMLLSNPHNPNGIIWTKEQLLKIEQICRENKVWIVSDEIHCDLLRSGKKHLPLAKLCPDNNQIITCMSPSKTFNIAGMQLSNIVIKDDDFRAKFKAHHYDIENPLSVVAIQSAYEEGEDWLENMLVYLDKNFEYLDTFLKTNLPETNFKIPEATYLAWVDLNAYFDDKELDLVQFFAEKAGVLLEAGNQFVKDGEGYIRLNLACPKAMLVDALDKILAAIKNQ